MADAEASKADAAAKGEEAAAAAPPAVGEQLRAIVGLIEQAVRHKETRVAFSKVLRQTQAARRRMTAADVQAFVRSTLPPPAAPPLTRRRPPLSLRRPTAWTRTPAPPPPRPRRPASPSPRWRRTRTC